MVTVNPLPPDTILPVITVPEDITVEATSPDGAQVSFEVLRKMMLMMDL
jgi:hypothetical protein